MKRRIGLVVALTCSTVLAAPVPSTESSHVPQSRWLVNGEVALAGLSDVTVTERPPFAVGASLNPEQFKKLNRYMTNHPGTYTVKVGGESIFVSMGVVSPGSTRTINSVNLRADTARPTPNQRVALTTLATKLLSVCYPEGQSPSIEAFWRERVARPWEKDLGWQEKKIGTLKVGWSGKDGFGYGGAGHSRPMTALEVSWPANGGRCVFY